MLPVHGLYGQVQRNNARAFVLLAAFFLLFEILAFMLWLPGAARENAFDRNILAVERQVAGLPINVAELRAPPLTTSRLIAQNFSEVVESGAWLTPLIYAACWLFVAWIFFKRAVRRATKAQAIERSEHPRLYNAVENLSMVAGIRRPDIYIMNTDAMNAYAAGLTRGSSMIAVSKGLLARLDDRELAAVLAHEIMHIKNADTRIVAIASLFSGIIFRFAWFIVSITVRPTPTLVLALPFLTLYFWQSVGVVLWACLATVICGWLARFAVTRMRDFIADAGAVELTKDPEALASALQKIEGHETLENVDVATDAMLFASSTSGALSTHPSPRERIAALNKALPAMATQSISGLANRDDGISWEALKAAGARTPKWVMRPIVILPALFFGLLIDFAAANVFNPQLVVRRLAHAPGVVGGSPAFQAPKGTLMMRLGVYGPGERPEDAKPVDVPVPVADSSVWPIPSFGMSFGAFEDALKNAGYRDKKIAYIGRPSEQAVTAPDERMYFAGGSEQSFSPPRSEYQKRTPKRSCFTIDGKRLSRPVDNTSALFGKGVGTLVKGMTSGDISSHFSRVSTARQVLAAAAARCPIGRCSEQGHRNYESALRDFMRARMIMVSHFLADYGGIVMMPAWMSFELHVDRVLIADMRLRLRADELKFASVSDVKEAIEVAMEGGVFGPCIAKPDHQSCRRWCAHLCGCSGRCCR